MPTDNGAMLEVYLRKCIENPDDASYREALADYCAANGRPAQAEALRSEGYWRVGKRQGLGRPCWWRRGWSAPDVLIWYVRPKKWWQFWRKV